MEEHDMEVTVQAHNGELSCHKLHKSSAPRLHCSVQCVHMVQLLAYGMK